MRPWRVLLGAYVVSFVLGHALSVFPRGPNLRYYRFADRDDWDLALYFAYYPLARAWLEAQRLSGEGPSCVHWIDRPPLAATEDP